MRTYVYIDGLNLYYRVLRKTPWKWLDLLLLCRNTLQPHHDVLKIRYFTTKVSSTPRDPNIHRRQETYLRALQQYRPEIKIHLGHFLTSHLRMPLEKPLKGRRTVTVIKTEEKGSDVNLAVHLLNDAWKDSYDCAVVISNDSDMAEGMRLARKEHPRKRFGLITPGSRRASHQLREHADFALFLNNRVLRNSQLPNPIPGMDLHKPENW